MVAIWRGSPKRTLRVCEAHANCWCRSLLGGVHVCRATPPLWAVGHRLFSTEGSVVESRPGAGEGVDGELGVPITGSPSPSPLFPHATQNSPGIFIGSDCQFPLIHCSARPASPVLLSCSQNLQPSRHVSAPDAPCVLLRDRRAASKEYLGRFCS